MTFRKRQSDGYNKKISGYQVPGGWGENKNARNIQCGAEKLETRHYTFVKAHRSILPTDVGNNDGSMWYLGYNKCNTWCKCST